MPLEEVEGVLPGARVYAKNISAEGLQSGKQLPLGPALLGRVLDGSGKPLDGLPSPDTTETGALITPPFNPLQRTPIEHVLDTGVRPINALLTVGRGQRMGLFAGSGVGKSVLLGMMARYTRADVIVVGLIGERGREVKDFIENNQVLLGLALFLTFFIMSPVIDKIYVDAYQPFSEEKISMQEALEKGAQPLREFMLRQTREADLGLFARLANTGPLQGPEAVPMRILLPAYVTSELKTAFQIGFTIFIPFLIIDLVIASVLMALGMMMVPPATIALPFKLMLFVLVDGWQLLVGSLAQSFYS
ncbi:flagellar type III secretion system pore protein FliP [Escherichia coli]|uniref:flagellar type III secretion system pore protein FliP n=1 Tax=Escherichia coli TaxID=562 RepID=UPI003F58AB63